MKTAASSNVLKALQVTITLIGYEAKPETTKALALELANYPEDQVLAALARCKTECKYRLSLSDVLDRIDDGWLGAEEAWALVPKSENESAVVTQEIMAAIPFDLLESNPIEARMAFKEAYLRLVAQARTERRAPVWFGSLGHDVGGRIKVIEDAVRLGRLSAPLAEKLLPHHELRDRAALSTPTPVGKLLADLRKP